MVFLQQIVNGLVIGAMYSVIGVGFTLIFGIMRLLNFAYGEFYMLASYGPSWPTLLLVCLFGLF